MALVLGATISSGGSTGGYNPTFTLSHTVDANSNLLVVLVSTLRNTGGGNVISGIKFNGVSMTQGVIKENTDIAGISTSIWYLINPTITTANTVATLSDPYHSVAFTILNFSGASLDSPFGNAGNDSGYGRGASCDVVGTSATNYIIDVVAEHSGIGANKGIGQTEFSNFEFGATDNNYKGYQLTSYEPGYGTRTMSWDWATNKYYAHCAVEVKEAPSSSSSSFSSSSSSRSSSCSSSFSSSSISSCSSSHSSCSSSFSSSSFSSSSQSGSISCSSSSSSFSYSSSSTSNSSSSSSSKSSSSFSFSSSSSSQCSSSHSSSSFSSSSTSGTIEKQVIFKLYDKNNAYVRVLDEVLLDYNIDKTLFGGSGVATFTLKSKIDELAADINYNSKIKVYSRNKWSGDPRLIYYGYITSIDPSVSDGDQQTAITCMGVISKLTNDYLRTGVDLAYEVTANYIDVHIKTILDHYRNSINTLTGSYVASMIAATTYFPTGTSPDGTVANASAVGSIPYRFFNQKHLDGINEIAKFLPKNDDNGNFWKYWIDDLGKFNLKLLSTSADHKLYMNKHLSSFEMRKNIEGLVNKVFFWNELGSVGGGILTAYDDNNSQANYEILADRISDGEITTSAQAQLLSQAKLYQNKDQKIEASVVVSEANYDILTFRVGDVVDIQDIKDPTLFRKMVLSGTADSGAITYCIDAERTEAEDYWNGYYIKFITGANAGTSAEITDFDATLDKIYFRALSSAVAAGDKYQIYTKTPRLIITKLNLKPREITLELATPQPDLTTQVETDRQYIEKQLIWFGNIVTRIDGSRLYSGSQQWVSSDIAFVPGDNPVGGGANKNTKISWTGGTFTLPNDVRRVISSGTSTTMLSDGTIYYFYVDEKNVYSDYDIGGAIIESGTCISRNGENFLFDVTKNWSTDQYKGYALIIDPGGANQEKHIISQNTNNVIYVESQDPVNVDSSSIAYRIYKLALRQTNTI